MDNTYNDTITDTSMLYVIHENTHLMKNLLLLLTLTFLTITFCSAQKIEVEKVFGGYKYSQNGEKLSLKELGNILEKKTDSFELYKKGKSNLLFSTILNFSGGLLIGIPIGQSVSGKKANWTLAGIGTGLAIVGITIYSSANKKINKSIEIHNSKQTSTALYEFNLNATSNGLSLSLRF